MSRAAMQAALDAPYEKATQEITSRYVVERRASGFWPYCVRAVGGTMEIFIGHKRQCNIVAAALQTACLDGAYMMRVRAEAALAQPEPDYLGRALELEACARVTESQTAERAMTAAALMLRGLSGAQPQQEQGESNV